MAEHIQRFCIKAVLAVVLALFGVLALAGLLMTANLGATAHSGEEILWMRDSFAANLAATLAVLLALLAGRRLMLRFGRRAGVLLLLCWTCAALVFLLGADTQQMYDFAYVSEAATLFAQGNYKPMTVDYFNVCSYQLGMCLPMEMALRLIPGLNLNLFMQGLGAVLSAGCVLMLAAAAEEITGKRTDGGSVVLLGCLFLPMLLYPSFVYGTLPMLFFVIGALLCFLRYLRTRKTIWGLAYAVLLAFAYMVKSNTAIMLLAFLIGAALDVLRSRDYRLLLFAGLSVVLAVVLARFAVMQYEWRSGVKLTPNVSMLSRLVMGLQEGGPAAGWYNRYIERFFPFEVTAAQEHAIASADLMERLAQMAREPGMTLRFFWEKLTSQWLEPAYGTMWYGNLCEQKGSLAAFAQRVYEQGGAIRSALEGYMNVFQQALYLLCCAGLWRQIRSRVKIGDLLLPLCVLGGTMYHMIFEAKSQYIFVYVLLSLPTAACGLAALDGWLCGMVKKRR